MTPAETAAILWRHAPELDTAYNTDGQLVMTWTCKAGCGPWKCASYLGALGLHEERQRRAASFRGRHAGVTHAA